MQTLSNTNTILCGDFNIDLLQVNQRPLYSDYFNTLLSNCFYSSITLPTRFSERNCTLIDNVFCNFSMKNKDVSPGLIICDISDHLPHFAFIHSKEKKALNNIHI